MHEVIFGSICAILFIWSFHLYHSANHMQDELDWEDLEDDDRLTIKSRIVMLYLSSLFVSFVAVLSATLV